MISFKYIALLAIVCVGCGGREPGAPSLPDASPVDAAVGPPSQDGAADTSPKDAYASRDAGHDATSADASVDAPSRDVGADASPADATLEASNDAGADGSLDATLDVSSDDGAAPDDATDGGPADAARDAPDPFASCIGSRDVFYLTYLDDAGAPLFAPYVATNLDTNWTLFANEGLDVDLDRRGAGPFGTLSISTQDGLLPPVGTYPVYPEDGSGTALILSLGGEFVGSGSGTFTITDLAGLPADGGPGVPSALALSYDFVDVDVSGDSIHGCLKYVASADTMSSFDAGLAPDADPITPCTMGGYVYYADGENGYPGLDGPIGFTGDVGTWSAGLTSGEILDVLVVDGVSMQLTAFVAGGVVPGVYPTQLGQGNQGGPYMNVTAGTCSGLPTGTFTISEIAAGDSDQASVTKLLMSWDLSCLGQGRLRGCVSYGN